MDCFRYKIHHQHKVIKNKTNKNVQRTEKRRPLELIITLSSFIEKDAAKNISTIVKEWEYYFFFYLLGKM